MYEVLLKSQPRKKLTSLARDEKSRISEKLIMLSDNPDDQRLDVKRMVGFDARWRLRVGQWRIIYDRLDTLRIIKITKIGSRGDVYK